MPFSFPRFYKIIPNGKRKLTEFGRLFHTSSVFLGGHVFLSYFYTYSSPYGASMLPTMLQSGELYIISKLHNRGANVRVGDIVVFKDPFARPMGGLIKRVIGLPGDFVMRDSPDAENDEMIQVPEGHCFVAGDNQKYSRDSRQYGPIPLAMITGKVVYRVLPYNRAGRVRNGLEKPDHDPS